MFAALSMEEVIAYVRNRQPAVEIVELRVLGKVQVLSQFRASDITPESSACLGVFARYWGKTYLLTRM